MMDFSRTTWHDQPYRYGVARPVFDDDLYRRMVAAWPDEGTFIDFKSAGYCKRGLSIKFCRARYLDFVVSSPVWRPFYAYVQSMEFIATLVYIADLPHGKYASRFEFSSMPCRGGRIDPHTDTPGKVLTLVVPIYLDGWDQSWGGGTDLLRPKDPAAKLVDYQAPLSAFDVAATVPYRPNQALLFLKSKASWHAVSPMTGPVDGPTRRTLTINVERTA